MRKILHHACPPLAQTANVRVALHTLADVAFVHVLSPLHIPDVKVGTNGLHEINKDKINELFSLPQNIKGFGPVKEASINATQLRRAELLLELENESLEKLAAE